ncbi:MAG: ribonuclease III domain-containing protein [Synechococcales bacterium]|nr:ribonuclease III domain-containing protein [Synechococcales bacterium]
MSMLPNFRDDRLLRQALTDPSYFNEHPDEGEHNQRLEFLGDSVLKYVLSVLLYRDSPNWREGAMTIWRSEMEQNRKLASVARQIGLGDHLRLGKGCYRQGDHDSDKVLSRAMEALIGAYHEDSGIQAVGCYIQRLLPFMLP